MPHATTGAMTDQLAGLFGLGTCAGLSDGELLERFRTGRDEGGERAFEAMVSRHGPMVLGICRNVLDDPSEVHDAFQAVFLVLVRRAGTIRKGESLGSWLYGVTVRVAARARLTAIRRRVRDRRLLAAASAFAPAGEGPGATRGVSTEPDDAAAIVHEEVVRLPEHFRTPIVLCYFEGLTHDEAAARLSCPVGTLRSRLARARDRLRTRLTRRGVAAPATIGPMAAWLIAGRSPSTASAAIRAAAAATPLPIHVPSLALAAVGVASGRPVAVGSLSAASMSLADGALMTMTLQKLTLAACLVGMLGIGTGTGAVLVRRVRAQDSRAAAKTQQTTRPASPAKAPEQSGYDPRLDELLDAARERLKAQQAYYEQGRITIDRFIQAGAHLQKVELLAAKTDGERTASRQRHVDRLKEIERRERAALNAGRSTEADLAEARLARLEAEFDLRAGEREDADKAALRRRVDELAREIERGLKERGGRGLP